MSSNGAWVGQPTPCFRGRLRSAAIVPPEAAQARDAAHHARGDVIGHYFDAAFLAHGFVFADGHLSTLDIPGATETYPWDISDNGTIVGYYMAADGRLHGFTTRK